jgi:hypothetical protein
MLPAGDLSGVVPFGADQTLFVVVDSRAAGARARQELQIEFADFDAVVNEFIAGQFYDPVRVIAFNTLEHWSKDLSADVAREIQTRCDIDGTPVPEHVQDFLERHGQAVSNRDCCRRA